MEDCAVAGIFVGRPSDVVADVEFARPNLVEHPAGHTVPQRCFDVRPRLDQLSKKAAQTQEFRVENRADAQPAAHFLAQRRGGALHVAGRGERAFGVRQQRLAVARQREAVRRAREQRHAEGFLQMLDLQADGGLGQMQLRGPRA